MAVKRFLILRTFFLSSTSSHFLVELYTSRLLVNSCSRLPCSRRQTHRCVGLSTEPLFRGHKACRRKDSQPGNQSATQPEASAHIADRNGASFPCPSAPLWFGHSFSSLSQSTASMTCKSPHHRSGGFVCIPNRTPDFQTPSPPDQTLRPRDG
jgi:hypothetical protein